MIRRPPRSTRTATLFPYTTLFRSVLVGLEALRRDEAHQQPSLTGVLRRVHGDHVLVHVHLVAVLGDDVADVVTLEPYRERGEGAHPRVHPRERVGLRSDERRVGTECVQSVWISVVDVSLKKKKKQ